VARGSDVAAISLTDVFRVYSTPEGDAAALQGLTLSIAEHEIVVVVGPSGSGKSTLLRLLAGLDRPAAGSVRVFEKEISKLSASKLAGYRASDVGYVDQHYTRFLAPELSAQEIVGLRLGFLGTMRLVRERRTLELLERVGLREKADAHPAELSGGEQQRIAVCAAVAHRPRLLLADEPTGELDAENAGIVYDLVAALARESGSTVVIVSHDPTSARIADRAVSIRDGRVSEEASSRNSADESIVVGRGGWLRLPEDLLARAGIRTRAVATLVEQGITISGTGEPEPGSRAKEGPTRPHSSPRRSSIGTVAVLRGVSKRWGTSPTPVFEDLDARFEAGVLHAITGPSGSGKTTLLHLLAGLDLPSAGEVRVRDVLLSELDRKARAEFRRKHIALVAQESMLVPFLSAYENVNTSLAIRGDNGQGDSAADVLTAVGLRDRMTQRVSRLSAGEQTRVAVARALAAGPALLLADEPTARLDQSNAIELVRLLLDLARQTGTAVLCATHDPVVIEHADAELSLGLEPRPVRE
jgi:ABC-type lipoprotein export system ATPase subunit